MAETPSCFPCCPPLHPVNLEAGGQRCMEGAEGTYMAETPPSSPCCPPLHPVNLEAGGERCLTGAGGSIWQKPRPAPLAVLLSIL
jgi:hypothetical protein